MYILQLTETQRRHTDERGGMYSPIGVVIKKQEEKPEKKPEVHRAAACIEILSSVSQMVGAIPDRAVLHNIHLPLLESGPQTTQRRTKVREGNRAERQQAR